MEKKSAEKGSCGYLDVDGGHRLFWSETGRREGPPLLLIHGGSGYIFDMEKISIGRDYFRIIEVHQRGVGRSLPFAETNNNTIDKNINDIETLRNYLGIDRWSLFSWSFGAVYMAAYALKFPQHCEGLTSYAPYLGSSEDFNAAAKDIEALEKYLKVNNATDIKGLITNSFNMAASPDFRDRFRSYFDAQAFEKPHLSYGETLNSKTREEWDIHLAVRRVGLALELELFEGHDRFLENLAAAHKVDSPISLVYGGIDNWSAPNSYAGKVFPKADIFEIPGCGHDVHDARVQNILDKHIRTGPRINLTYK